MDKATATKIHPLADHNEKGGQIKFIHCSNGEETIFYSVVNSMTGDRMTWFNQEAPTINDSVSWVRGTFKGIRAKCKVLEVIGDF